MIIQTMAEGAVRVARSIEFSTAHFYRQDQLSDSENLKTFGACFTPHGHGHNYRLEVLLEGVPSLVSGLLIERSAFDTHLREAVQTLDHHHANFDVPEFRERTDGTPTLIPTTENLCLYLVGRLQTIFSTLSSDSSEARCKLVSVTLHEMSDLWVEWTEAGPCLDLNAAKKAFIEWTQEVSFRASHRLGLADASESENFARFGSCTKTHGHLYRLQVSLRRVVEADAGLGDAVSSSGDQGVNSKSARGLGDVVPANEFEAFLKENIVERLDGKNLNQEFPEITHTTPESLLLAISGRLRTKVDRSRPGGATVLLAKMAIFDGENGYAEMRFLN